MERLKLISQNDIEVIYEYYPEGSKEHPGKIRGEFATKKAFLLEQSKDDQFGRYGAHAVKRVSEYLEKGEILEQDIIAWY